MASNDTKEDVIMGYKSNIFSHAASSFGGGNARYSERGFHSSVSELSSFNTCQSTIDSDVLVHYNRSPQVGKTGFAGESNFSVALGPAPGVIAPEPRVFLSCLNPEKDHTTGLDQDNLTNEMKTINAIKSELT